MRLSQYLKEDRYESGTSPNDGPYTNHPDMLQLCGKGVNITLDFCPTELYPEYKLLSLLDSNNIPYTVFLSVMWCLKNPALFKVFKFADNVSIGVHGYFHTNVDEHPIDENDDRVQIEVINAFDWFENQGVQTKLYRFPNGHYTEDAVQLLKKAGKIIVGWDVLSNDKGAMDYDKDTVIKKIAEGTQEGSIWCFHGNGEGKETHDIIREVLEIYDHQLFTALPQRMK